MDSKYNGSLWYTSVPPDNMTKNLVINLHSGFYDWHSKNPNIHVEFPNALQRDSKSCPVPAAPKPDIVSEPLPKPQENPLNPRGKQLLHEKIAEIEDRIMYSGMVNSPEELDLEDSFIDDSLHEEEKKAEVSASPGSHDSSSVTLAVTTNFRNLNLNLTSRQAKRNFM